MEQLAKFRYKNYKGITAERTVVLPGELYFGSTEYHPTPQMLLRAFDVDKQDYRTYAWDEIEKPLTMVPTKSKVVDWEIGTAEWYAAIKSRVMQIANAYKYPDLVTKNDFCRYGDTLETIMAELDSDRFGKKLLVHLK